MSEAAVRLKVEGRVQGVFFRASTERVAKELGVAGWVRNLDDGSVEIHAEGGRETLDRLIDWCRQGPTLARVENVDVNWTSVEGLRSFDIR
ncbi:acylphosphatase [Nitrospina watsonii]|uniref:Acylphosphatase n=1 Tax=Nitrospina watsonii TaxID=1323948 RepID=A0ABM9HAX1_9BACT|nr:acylphosphatase [Nitrospina watsonii]CAI2717282.1 Acylphosphatase [Nitrospina watsonii]